MTKRGFSISLDTMREIRQGVIDLNEIAHDWSHRWDSRDFPSDAVACYFLQSLFHLERALNPERLAWDDFARRRPPILDWPYKITTGLWWLRDVLDALISRIGAEEIATSKSLRNSLRDWIRAHPDFSLTPIEPEDLRQLEQIVERLGSIDGLTIEYQGSPDESQDRILKIHGGSIPAQPSPGQMRPEIDEALLGKTKGCPVVLKGDREPVIILGCVVPPVSKKQYSVVEALVAAYPRGLSAEALRNKCGKGDVLGAIRRLKSLEGWPRVIQAGGGHGYRLGYPSDYTEPTADHHEPEVTHSDQHEALETPQVRPSLTHKPPAIYAQRSAQNPLVSI